MFKKRTTFFKAGGGGGRVIGKLFTCSLKYIHRNLNEVSYPDTLEILHKDNNAGNDAITQNDSEVKSFDSDNSYDEFPEYTTPSYDLAPTPVINLNCSGTCILYSIQ